MGFKRYGEGHGRLLAPDGTHIPAERARKFTRGTGKRIVTSSSNVAIRAAAAETMAALDGSARYIKDVHTAAMASLHARAPATLAEWQAARPPEHLPPRRKPRPCPGLPLAEWLATEVAPGVHHYADLAAVYRAETGKQATRAEIRAALPAGSEDVIRHRKAATCIPGATELLADWLAERPADTLPRLWAEWKAEHPSSTPKLRVMNAFIARQDFYDAAHEIAN